MTLTENRASTDEQRVEALVDDLLTQFPPRTTEPRTFLGEQYDRGLAWVHFDEGHGGLGVSAKLQRIVNERVAAAGGPNAYYRNPIGYGMCGPTVAVWGTDEQKRRYLRPLFTGEEIWCQLFSEPGSGSDFAGLSSRAIKDGEEWLVNGQKVWTTLAMRFAKVKPVPPPFLYRQQSGAFSSRDAPEMVLPGYPVYTSWGAWQQCEVRAARSPERIAELFPREQNQEYPWSRR